MRRNRCTGVFTCSGHNIPPKRIFLNITIKRRSVNYAEKAEKRRSKLRPMHGYSANDHCSDFALVSRKSKNAQRVFLLSVRRLLYLILSDVIKGMKADCNSL
ncbi:hypothetical protein HMPREF1325_0454 [Treponema socranskii subsp. socranskii VPI DR56BR1116 = ATCC 35536]|uniref:Uncharacterized protein n=1 Tax=Treponema socranskii subsp. socranskii VPI DR56BR1116 = ATCC 35536 TaxID=1125725 RepID=U1F9L3_TRESO|nr:hypothetical protein HMPREF1325_0454 [Treponema socranskii subsp. socranskii VPI DR56BR1116 = ATCC 35536]